MWSQQNLQCDAMAPPRDEVVQYMYEEYDSFSLLLLGTCAALILILLLLLCSLRSTRRSVDLHQHEKSVQDLQLKNVKRGTAKIPEPPESQNRAVPTDPEPAHQNKAQNNQKNKHEASVKTKTNLLNQNSKAEEKSPTLRGRNLPSIPRDSGTTENALEKSKREEPLYDTVNEKEPSTNIISSNGQSNGSVNNGEATGKTATVPLYSKVPTSKGSLKKHQNQENLYEELKHEAEPRANSEAAHANRGPSPVSQRSNSPETSFQTQENTESTDQIPNLTDRHLPLIPQDDVTIQSGLDKINVAYPLYDTVNEIHDGAIVPESRIEPPLLGLQVPIIEVEPAGNIVGHNGDNKSDGSLDNGETNERKKIGIDPLYSVVHKNRISQKKQPHQESLDDEMMQEPDTDISASRTDLNSSQTSLDMVSMAYMRAKKRGKDDTSINSEREEPPPLPEKQFNAEDENQ
ncbi:uncharacterized protein LOC108718301 isoform X2 [Xenopus laevis]|uniref:Uncharacterized protein LOC108718301 isoform X2 n=1 Tax=Xenopus laevis TaxID=8355 RepID=A0A8J1KUQ1_XENLA|nr:uncharacterized protein LOC108718301 isoform X2 [Xenopus laevis]